MKQIIYAMTGEVKAGKNNIILRSSAIGSCIAITTYDKQTQIGVMAHVMLPGKAPENRNIQKTRYASDAVDKLINILELNRANANNIEVCIAGGANVLDKKDDDIGHDIIMSVEELLKKRKIKVVTKSLGGILRRSVSLDVETGCVKLTIGDEVEKLFWNFKE